MMKCPFCAEEIQDAAKKCNNCSKSLEGVVEAKTPAIETPALPATRKPLSEILPRWLQGTILVGLMLLGFMHPVLIVLPVAWTVVMRGPWWLLWLGFLAWAASYRNVLAEATVRGTSVGWLTPAYYACLSVVGIGVIWHQVQGWHLAGKKANTSRPRVVIAEILARLRARPDLALLPAAAIVLAIYRLSTPGLTISRLMPDLRSQSRNYIGKTIQLKRTVVVTSEPRDEGFVCSLVDANTATNLPRADIQKDVLYCDFGPPANYGLKRPLVQGCIVEVEGQFDIGNEYRFVAQRCRVIGFSDAGMERPSWISLSLWRSSNLKATACMAGLKELDAAKNQWAVDNKKPLGSEVTEKDLEKYVPSNLACPSGGKLTIGRVGESPSCSIHGFLDPPTVNDAAAIPPPAPISSPIPQTTPQPPAGVTVGSRASGSRFAGIWFSDKGAITLTLEQTGDSLTGDYEAIVNMRTGKTRGGEIVSGRVTDNTATVTFGDTHELYNHVPAHTATLHLEEGEHGPRLVWEADAATDYMPRQCSFHIE